MVGITRSKVFFGRWVALHVDDLNFETTYITFFPLYRVERDQFDIAQEKLTPVVTLMHMKTYRDRLVELWMGWAIMCQLFAYFRMG